MSVAGVTPLHPAAWRPIEVLEDSTRRRLFLASLASATIVGPRASFAQSTKVYRLATLSPGAPFGDKSPFGSILVRVLGEHGYKLGQI